MDRTLNESQNSFKTRERVSCELARARITGFLQSSSKERKAVAICSLATCPNCPNWMPLPSTGFFLDNARTTLQCTNNMYSIAAQWQFLNKQFELQYMYRSEHVFAHMDAAGISCMSGNDQ